MKRNIVSSLALLSLVFLVACQNTTSNSKDSSFDIDSSCLHDYQFVNKVEPSIIKHGYQTFECSLCHDKQERNIAYDLSQYVFEDMSFMYDGNEHQVVIKGMLPLGTHTVYKDNSLKEIGEKEATASIYDDKDNLLETKTAKIKIVENKGFPNIYVSTNNAPIEDKENYVTMKLSTDNCDGTYVKNNVTGGIRLRGNGTLTYDKKAYRLKLDGKTNLFGLNNGLKAKSWVLLADYADQSMLRNMTALNMGNSLFNYSNNYASDYMHVNLYLNDSYNGVYLLAEQQQVNSSRVNVHEPADETEGNDVGYFLELDSEKYAKEEDYYFTVGNQSGFKVPGTTLPQKYYSIKSDIYKQEQVTYIQKYLTNVFTIFVRAINDEGFYTLDENHDLKKSEFDNIYETLNAVIDLESLFKMYILHELMKNVDVGFSSFYMFVDFSKNSIYPRLTFGAPWDFDWSSGNVNRSPYQTSSGAYNSTVFDHMNPWFYLLSQTNFFKDYIKDYYQVFLDSHIFENALANIDYETTAFSSEFKKNYDKWKNLGTIVPVYTPNEARNFKVHKDAVDYFTNWLNARKKTLDSLFL